MKNKLRFWFAGISLLILVLDILIIVNNSGSTYAAATIKKTYCCADSGLSCISDNSKSCGFCSSGWKLCSPTLPKKYSVTFNMNGGSYEGSSTKKINYSSTYSFSGKPSWNNRVFIGWSKNDSSCSCDKKFNEGTVSGGSGDNGSVYYACWRDAYCWGCNKDGDYIGYRVSYDSPIISGISCQNDKWKTPGSNPYGTGTWTKVSYSVYCNACDGPTPPPPNNTETEACYKCSYNGEYKYKYGFLSEIDDSFCEGTIEKQEGVSKNECKESTITEKHCTVDKPSDDKLSCNSSKTLESTCDNRTIIIDDLGYADVKIEQKGYISSILTPDRIHQGGGFSFGVVYTNTVKWSYINNSATGELHNEITKKMNDKIIDYNSYIESLKLSEIKFGGKSIDSSFLVKKCSTSSEIIDYYNKELTTTCLFYLPDSVLDKDGNVNYIKSGALINNKYYVPLDFIGNYKIEASITGMSRIKNPKSDGKDSKSWTGDWDDYGKINNCNIDVYSLFYKNKTDDKTVYNFIYRPIDINNPFPNRNAGINWYDWYSIDKNKKELINTYKNKQYEIELDNNKISNIKEYNKNKNYLDWDSINNDTGKSSFVTEYVDRVGGNS